MPTFPTTTGVNIYYELHGDGDEKAVFIMGLHTSHLAWVRQLPFFVNDGRFQLLIMDNRGMGLSDKPLGPYTTKQMAQDIYEVIQHLGWLQYHIVGHSMGGMISQELALLAPQNVKSLCLACTHAGGITATPPLVGILESGTMHLKSPNLERLAHYLLQVNFTRRFMRQKDELTGLSNYQVLTKELMHEMEAPGSVSMVGVTGQLAAIMGHYVSTGRLRKLKKKMKGAPILVLTADRDKLVKPENGREIAKILDCKLVEFVRSGHMVFKQYPQWFNAVVLENLERGMKKSKL